MLHCVCEIKYIYFVSHCCPIQSKHRPQSKYSPTRTVRLKFYCYYCKHLRVKTINLGYSCVLSRLIKRTNMNEWMTSILNTAHGCGLDKLISWKVPPDKVQGLWGFLCCDVDVVIPWQFVVEVYSPVLCWWDSYLIVTPGCEVYSPFTCFVFFVKVMTVCCLFKQRNIKELE